MAINRKLRGIRDPVDPGYILGRPKNMGKGPAVQLKAPPGFLSHDQAVHAVNSVGISSTSLSVSGSPVTNSGNITVELPTVGNLTFLGNEGGGAAIATGILFVAGTGITLTPGAGNLTISSSDGNGTGNVSGPGSSTAGNITGFFDNTGDVISDLGVSIDTDGTLAADSDGFIPTQKAVKTYVDASAGGGSSFYPAFTSPNDGAYSWGNQNGSSTSTYGNGALLFSSPGGGADQIMMRGELAITSGYTFILGFLPSMTRGNEAHTGIYVRDSVGGKIKIFARYADSGSDGLIYYKWNSPSSFSTIVINLAAPVEGFIYLKLVDDTTDIIAYYSVDGYTFFEWAREARTTFTTPNKIGATLRNASASIGNGMIIYDWEGP